MTRFLTEKGLVEIRELGANHEMVEAEKIQNTVWGADIIPHPKEILIPIQHEGGLLAGAFSAGGEMVGLIFGFPTADPLIQHSQMLATLEEWRGLGIGAQMKWFQRLWCLERGIKLVRWTVDPLRAPNAELNFRRLGGISSTYYADYYGVMQGIDAGAPTDRLLVEWDLLGARATSRAVRAPEDHGFPQAAAALEISGERPVQNRIDWTCPALRARLPDHFVQLSKTNPVLALEWRLRSRELLQEAFSRGYRITEFTRVDGPAYLLERNTPVS